MTIRFALGATLVLAGAATAVAWVSGRSDNIGASAYPFEIEHPEVGLPAGRDEKTEYAFARLRYHSLRGPVVFYSWGMDAPKSERQFVQGVRRLTRLHTSPLEQVVSVDNDKLYDWPWMFALEVGYWDLSPPHAARLREYLLRGGFLMIDDFHGTAEWYRFMEGMKRVFPDRPMVDIENSDQIFNVVYELKERIQVPGLQFLESGRLYERDGVIPRWRGVYDDQKRLMVLVCHNQDNGDAWEWADHPAYPEPYASQAYRLGINSIIYSMTH
ncbi:MAG: DUF4159 domain-containing protein [Bryobacteraceae bacterium]